MVFLRACKVLTVRNASHCVRIIVCEEGGINVKLLKKSSSGAEKGSVWLKRAEFLGYRLYACKILYFFRIFLSVKETILKAQGSMPTK